MAKTKVPSEADLTVTEKTEKLDSKIRSVPSLGKSGSSTQTETQRTCVSWIHRVAVIQLFDP